MRQSRPFLALGLTLALCAPAIAQNKPTPAKKPAKRVARSLKLGVVDIGVLFKSYKRKDVLEEAINTRREAMKAEIDKEIGRIKDMSARLQKSDLRPGSDAYNQAATDIKLANYALELKQKSLQASLKKHVEQQTLQILNELQKTIEEYGKTYRYDLILKIDRGGREGAKGELYAQFQEEIFRAQISDILYFSRTLDITKNVERELNKSSNLKKRALEAK
jgi:Skp family chaperone for outer membrane proteins